MLTNADIITLLELAINRLEKKKSLSPSKSSSTIRSSSGTVKKNNINDIIILGKFIMTQVYLQTIIKRAQPFLHQRATLELSKSQKYLHSNKGKRKKNNIDINLTDDDIVHHLVDNQGLDTELAIIVSTKLKRTFLNEIQTMIQSTYLTTLNDNSTNENNNGDDEWIENQKSNIQSILLDLGRKMYFNFKSIQFFEGKYIIYSLFYLFI